MSNEIIYILYKIWHKFEQILVKINLHSMQCQANIDAKIIVKGINFIKLYIIKLIIIRTEYVNRKLYTSFSPFKFLNN